MSDRLSLSGILILALMMCSLTGCDSNPADSLYDPDRPFRPDPVITAVEPSDSSLAGVGTITILGENFSSVAEENLVYFGQTRVTVLEASEGQLVIQPPAEPGEDLVIRATTIGAEDYSNSISYKLMAAVESFGDVGDFEESHALATDAAGYVYVSMFASNVSAGIQRIASDGTRREYIPSTFKWDALHVEADGTVYGVRNVRAIFRFAGEGASQEVWAVSPNMADRFVAMTAYDGYLWVGGYGGNIYRVDADGNLEGFPLTGDIRDLVVHNGSLYAAANDAGQASVLRIPITNGQLGSAETYFDVTGFAGAGVEALSLAMTAEGELFVGTTAADPLILVGTDGSATIFYEGLMDPPAYSLAWGSGGTLYMSRTDVVGAPSRILKINTLRERSR